MCRVHALFDVAGRVALVTGSSRGIGRALAGGLAGAGATVVLNGRDPDAVGGRAGGAREGSRAHRARRSLRRDGFGGASAPPSIASRTRSGRSTSSSTTRASRTARRSSISPTTSGTAWSTPTSGAAFRVGREVARRMQPRGRGKIVNICSVQSEAARPGTAVYAATKGGLKMLTKGMCADLGPFGIQVNGLAPGLHRDRADRAADRRPGIRRLAPRPHTRRSLGQRGRPRRPAAVPRLPRRRLRQRADPHRRRRHARRAVGE